MATIEIAEIYAQRPAFRLVITMPAVLWTYVRRRRRRQVLAQFARLPDHLIRDAGFDPDEVHEAVAGTWDIAHPRRARIR